MDASCDLEEKSRWKRAALEWEIGSDRALGLLCLLQHSQERGGRAVRIALLRDVVDYLAKLGCELLCASPRRSRRMGYPGRRVCEIEFGRNHRWRR